MLLVSLVVPFLLAVWFWGRGSARFRVVRLGGPEVRKARSNVADVHEAVDTSGAGSRLLFFGFHDSEWCFSGSVC